MTGTESKMLKQHVRRGARSNFGTAAGQNSRLMRTMKAAPQICRPCAPKRAVQIQCPKGNILQADDELGAGPAAGRVCELVNAGPPMISGEAIVNAWKERRRSHATPPLPQHPQLPADCYSHILKFINVADRPLTNRASLVSYVQKKNRRLGAIPLLVDLSWHGGTCLGRYCVCRAATLQERIEEYARDDRLYT